MTITVQQAQLDTVQVAVHAIRVGRKQMTQAVFRQLLPEHPFDHEREELRGNLWGTVNYFWNGCDRQSIDLPHLHLVWQLDDELRRACIYPNSGCDELQEALTTETSRKHDAVTLALFRRVLNNPDSVKKVEDRLYSFQFAGWSCGQQPEDAQDIITILAAKTNFDFQQEELAEARTSISDHLDTLEEDLENEAVADEDQINIFYQKCANKIAALYKNYEVLHQLVKDLPQLFIAV